MNTENLISMERMFSYCLSLAYIDISSFNGTNLIYFDRIFYQSRNITLKINKNFFEKIKSWVPKNFKIVFD